MPRWWKANLWKIVLFPALAGLIAIGYSLLQGTAHRWLGFDSQGHSLGGETPVAARKPITLGEVLAAIGADLNRAEPRQRTRLRYLTLVHRHNEPAVTNAELQVERQALADLVVALAPPNRTGTVTPIDAAGLLFRLDLDCLGWSAEEWRQVAILYPYGLSYESLADESLRTTDEAIHRDTDDQVPLVRADWFVAASSRPPLGGPGGRLGLWTRTPPEKVQAVVRAYAGQPLDLAVAARELGASVEALRQLLTEEAYWSVKLHLTGYCGSSDIWRLRKQSARPLGVLGILVLRSGIPRTRAPVK